LTLLVSSVWLGLAWFAVVNAMACVVAWLVARRLLKWGRCLPTAPHLLAIRLGPAIVAAVFTVLVFLPVHWRFEPLDSDESFGFVVRGLALVSGALLVRAGWRAYRALRQSAALQSLVMPTLGRAGDRAYVSDRHEGISLAGVFRTRVIVGSEACARLTPAELDVAIAHERAHERSRDNLKRLAMCCAPDFLGGTGIGRRLEAAWRAAAECQADALAVAGSETRAVDLASALVKVARVTSDSPTAVRPPVWSTFHEAPLLETRVRRLLNREPSAEIGRHRLSLSCVMAAVAGSIWMSGHQLHWLTETLVRWLP
jgi:Zn-dependent protease with chaperone function